VTDSNPHGGLADEMRARAAGDEVAGVANHKNKVAGHHQRKSASHAGRTPSPTSFDNSADADLDVDSSPGELDSDLSTSRGVARKLERLEKEVIELKHEMEALQHDDIYILKHDEHEVGESYQGCTATNGKQCAFPFKYIGITYTTCTTHDNKGKAWCSTQTDSHGEHIAGKFGECPASCKVTALQG
jgi:hypothetical protein